MAARPGKWLERAAGSTGKVLWGNRQEFLAGDQGEVEVK